MLINNIDTAPLQRDKSNSSLYWVVMADGLSMFSMIIFSWYNYLLISDGNTTDIQWLTSRSNHQKLCSEKLNGEAEWIIDVVESVHFELLALDECKLDLQSNHELLCSDKLNWEAGADILSGCIFAHSLLPPILLLVCSHFSDWYLCLCLCLYLYLYFCICSFWCIFHTHSHPFPQSFFLYHTFPTPTSIYCPKNSMPLNLSFYFELFFDKAP